MVVVVGGVKEGGGQKGVSEGVRPPSSVPQGTTHTPTPPQKTAPLTSFAAASAVGLKLSCRSLVRFDSVLG